MTIKRSVHLDRQPCNKSSEYERNFVNRSVLSNYPDVTIYLTIFYHKPSKQVLISLFYFKKMHAFYWLWFCFFFCLFIKPRQYKISNFTLNFKSIKLHWKCNNDKNDDLVTYNKPETRKLENRHRNWSLKFMKWYQFIVFISIELNMKQTFFI